MTKCSKRNRFDERPGLMGTGKILVIKLGALGDFVQALGPCKAIRDHHKGAHITLMTGGALRDFAAMSGYFDDIWTGCRPAMLDIGGWLRLRRRLRGGNFERVYDLQTSSRSCRYFRLFRPGPWPQWSGIAKGCSHPHANPDRDSMHTIERQAEQLKMAGIGNVPPADLSWVPAAADKFNIGGDYALLVPGGAPHRQAKRWPAACYAGIGRRLAEQGILPVILGTGNEMPLQSKIRARCPNARTLAGQTDLAGIVRLARGARLAVGNDTGPMHLIAAAGCRSYILYSAASDPALCAQAGPDVTIVRRRKLSDLSLEEIAETIFAGRLLDSLPKHSRFPSPFEPRA